MKNLKNIRYGVILVVLIFCWKISGAAGGSIDSLSIKFVNPIIGDDSLCELSFVVTDTLAPDAVFVVTFPNGFDVSGVQIAGSRTINGGFFVSVVGQKVTIRRQGVGRRILPGKKLDLSFSTVMNARVPGDYAVTVEIQDATGSKIGGPTEGLVSITPKR